MSYHGTHVVVIEIPEGSWGAGGQTIDTEKISKLIGATQDPKRLAEGRKNAAKLSLQESGDWGHLTKRKVMYVKARRSCFWNSDGSEASSTSLA
jgi:hypothetical protein